MPIAYCMTIKRLDNRFTAICPDFETIEGLGVTRDEAQADLALKIRAHWNSYPETRPRLGGPLVNGIRFGNSKQFAAEEAGMFTVELP